MPSWKHLRNSRDEVHHVVTTIEELQHVPPVSQGAGTLTYELRAIVRRGEEVLFTLTAGPVASSQRLSEASRLEGEVFTRLEAGANL